MIRPDHDPSSPAQFQHSVTNNGKPEALRVHMQSFMGVCLGCCLSSTSVIQMYTIFIHLEDV